MSNVSFADVVHQSITFDRDHPVDALLLDLIDTPWMQRLRDIHQTANTRLVYMFSEHSRFGHSLGVGYMAKRLMDKLEREAGTAVEPYRMAVAAAALVHDIGHLAPGSHIAAKVWFPDKPDQHEQTAGRIVSGDPGVRTVLESRDRRLPELVAQILNEDPELPPWTWQIISGGGWNVDRGNWCIVDSIFAGVSYGQYNIPALADSIVLTPSGELALRENRLDAMMHFAVSRQAMYRQVYQHRVLLSSDTLNLGIIRRARDLGGKLLFADDAMRAALSATNTDELSLKTIFAMRESWWRYHVSRWIEDQDPILRDLCDRLVNRRLFKTVRITADSGPELRKQAEAAVQATGLDPHYYLHEVRTADVQRGDSHQSMSVLLDDGSLQNLSDADPLIAAMMRESGDSVRSWLVMPEEAKKRLGRER